MSARIEHPAFAVPGAMDALQALGKAVGDTGLSPVLVELICLRASQINGCSVCVYGHCRALRELGESADRLDGVSAWREMPFYTDAERAAFELCEATTRLSDRGDAVSDEVWKGAANHFDGTQLAALVLTIANINLWNRLNAPTRQPAGATW
ncbi:MAG: carboxymuconolactone decarboxylase protein [Ilumatobacteraceae bacterium]|nr:carboxymuconolactone decarboxylase protein [Ilumatobacteraceae bacterium]